MPKKIQRKEFSIKELSLWDENPRFPEEYFKKTEHELIDYYLIKKGVGIKDLAEEIANDSDLPQLERIVVWKYNGKSVVLEGNRRLVVYKLIASPSLVKERPELEKYFTELQKRTGINNDFKLEANVTTNKEEGLRYVDRKHNKGNNEVGWVETERRNFAIRRSGGNIRDMMRVALANAVKRLSLPDTIKESVLGKGYVTTFYRIADSAAARAKLGYELRGDGTLAIKNQKIFDDLLKVIVFNIWSKKDHGGRDVDSRSLNKIEAINLYIKNIKSSDSRKVEAEISKHVKEDLFGVSVVVPGLRMRGLPLPTSRKHLITSALYIPSPRIREIYNELKRELNVDQTPNAVSVLFRVFLECSVDYYIEQNKIKVKDDTQLAGKISKVTDHLEDYLAAKYLSEQGVAKPTQADLKKAKDKVKLKSIRKVATKDNNSVLSVTTFHDFVHDHKVSPISSELKKHWDNLDSFFVSLWGTFASGEKKK